MLRRVAVTATTVLAFALAAGSAQAEVSISSFSLTPSTTQAGSNPSVTVSAHFSSADGDTPKDATISLAPGLLADPNAPTVCDDSDFANDSCPGSSQIGQGSISGTFMGGSVSIPTSIYRVTSAGSEIARIGIIADFFDTPIPITAPVEVRSTPDVGLDIPITGIPNQIAGGNVQITGLTLTLDGTVNGRNFTRNPTSCAAADSHLTIDSYADPSTQQTADSPFTPTGCSSLAYAPKLTASESPDKSDDGVALAIEIKQAAGEAATKKIKVTLPSSLAPRLSALAGGTVGSATVTTPLLASPLRGQLTVSNSGLDAVFGPPLNLVLQGTPQISGGVLSATFSSVPDVPITDLKVNFDGGSGSLLMQHGTGCSDLTGDLGAYNGKTAHLVAALGCHEGKPTAHLELTRGKHRKLTITVVPGQNAPAIHSVSVKLPSRVHVAQQSVGSGGREATIVLEGKGLKRHHTLTVVLTVTDISGARTELTLTQLL